MFISVGEEEDSLEEQVDEMILEEGNVVVVGEDPEGEEVVVGEGRLLFLFFLFFLFLIL